MVAMIKKPDPYLGMDRGKEGGVGGKKKGGRGGRRANFREILLSASGLVRMFLFASYIIGRVTPQY